MTLSRLIATVAILPLALVCASRHSSFDEEIGLDRRFVPAVRAKLRRDQLGNVGLAAAGLGDDFGRDGEGAECVEQFGELGRMRLAKDQRGVAVAVDFVTREDVGGNIAGNSGRRIGDLVRPRGDIVGRGGVEMSSLTSAL